MQTNNRIKCCNLNTENITVLSWTKKTLQFSRFLYFCRKAAVKWQRLTRNAILYWKYRAVFPPIYLQLANILFFPSLKTICRFLAHTKLKIKKEITSVLLNDFIDIYVLVKFWSQIGLTTILPKLSCNNCKLHMYIFILIKLLKIY